MKHFKEVDLELDKIATAVVDAAFKVHFNLGPGLLENAYEACLAFEIGAKGLKAEKQVELPLAYQTVRLNVGYRIDLLVENRLIVEVKAVESLLPVHRAQVITYLKLSGNQLGFLMNFNAPILKKGLERIVLSKVSNKTNFTAKTPSSPRKSKQSGYCKQFRSFFLLADLASWR